MLDQTHDLTLLWEHKIESILNQIENQIGSDRIKLGPGESELNRFRKSLTIPSPTKPLRNVNIHLVSFTCQRLELIKPFICAFIFIACHFFVYTDIRTKCSAEALKSDSVWFLLYRWVKSMSMGPWPEGKSCNYCVHPCLR